MPPKKRTLQEADSKANANASAPASKNQKRAAEEQENQPEDGEDAEVAGEEQTQSDGAADESSQNKDRSPDEWICVDQPFWDFEYAADHGLDDDNSEDEEDEDEDEDEDGGLRDKYMKEVVEKKVWGTPAAEKPEYKWKMVWDAWKQMCELRVQEDY